MSTSRFISKFAVLSIALLLSATVHGAISVVIVSKEAFFYQGGPSSEDVTLSDGYGILAEVQVENQSDASNVSVRLPDGESVPMAWDADEQRYFVEESGFSTSSALDSAHPNGSYAVKFTPVGGSQISKTLRLANGFPPHPVVENWFDMRHFPVGEDVVIRWSAMTNGAAKDVINLEIADRATGDLVFETGVHYFNDPNSLDGTDTSMTIPAGTLQTGKDYRIILGFTQIDEIDIGQTLTDVLMGATHYTETNLDLIPVTRHPSSVIDWGIVGRWTRYDQIGADTVNPKSSEEFASVLAIMKPNAITDLSNVIMNGQIPLVSDVDSGVWLFVLPVSSEVDLDAWLPNGDVTLAWSFSAGGSHSTRLDLQGGPLNPLRVSNWSELQSADAATVTPIRWMAPEFWRDSDAFVVTIRDENENIVFETPFDLGSAAMLRGEDRLLNLPANALESGKVYDARIQFIQITDLDENSQTGAFFAAANAVETEFTINTGAAVPEAVAFGAVGRELYYRQSGPGSPELDLTDDEQFGSLALLVGESVSSLVSASVVLPGGAERALQYNGEDAEYFYGKSNSSLAALLADFGSGDYTLKYQKAGGANIEVSLNLDGTFPSVPQLINWSEARSVDAAAAFTLKWLPVAEMTQSDLIQVYIEDGFGNEVLFSPPVQGLNPGGIEGLEGTATSITLPAGALSEDTTYFVSLDAVRLSDLDEVSVPGATFGAFNLVSVSFDLVTTSGNMAPTITTASLTDALEGKPYSAGIEASDPESGSDVALSAVALPGWLSLADNGDGTAVLTGTPGGANLGSFTVTVSATDPQGLVSTREFTLKVDPDLSDPEGRALDIQSVGWQRDDAAPFLPQIGDVQFGESALVSGVIGDSGVSFLEAVFTGPVKLSFFWKVSSQAGKDFFRVRVDGTTAAEISGNRNWRERIVDVPTGSHTVRWAYEKDGTGSAGTDRGWVDHLVILPAEAGVYAGTYLGDIASSTGEVSLFVRPNNTAVFLGYHPESGKGLSNFAFTISDLGTFSFEVVNPDDMGNNYRVTGSVSGGVATGSVSGLNLSFTANLVSGGGQAVSYDGYYQNALTATTSGLVFLIVATDGQAYFFAQDRNYVEGFITTIDALGQISLMTGKGFDYDLKVDPSTDIVAGTYTPPGGEASSILGIREGSPGDELLANISTRGKVLTGGKVMIASFVINGTGSKQLLIRAIGPKLADFGVAGVLQDPIIDLIRLGDTSPIFTNDDWEEGAQVTRVIAESIRLGAFALNTGGLDSVMIVGLEPGAYTAKIRGSGNLTGVSLVEVYDGDDSQVRRSTADIVNIATRGEVGTGADVLIAGFVVAGDVPKRILLRGIGPQLAAFGVVGAIVDPRMDLINSDQELVASNDDWGDNPDVAAVVAASGEVGAFDLEDGSKDAALLIWLEPGTYSAKLSGVDGGTGVALIEVYDN